MIRERRLYKIYILGNPNFEQDSLPVKLLPKLKSSLPNFEFIHLDPTENLPEQDHLILIDTILNINEVKLLTESDLEKIQSSPSYSLHDFDLGFQLKLMKKLDKIKKITVIGVPDKKNEIIALNQIKKLLNKII
jgi:Ni,Fe-hydrogenase maturation factor